MNRKIYFRTDGNNKIGHGHVIRCTALVDMLRNDFNCTFLIYKPSEFLITEIQNAGADYIEITETQDYISEAKEIAAKYIKGTDIVVLDGYNFETEYQKIIKNTGCKLVCIDDIHQYHFVADAVINHGGENCENKYSITENTKLFLGFDYLMVRKQFYENRLQKQFEGKIKSVLLSFGGSQTYDLQEKFVKAVLKLHEIEIINLITSSKSKISHILQNDRLNIYENLKVEELIQIANDSDIIICAASTFALEMCILNKPMICGYFVENQNNIYNCLLRNNMIIGIGNINSICENLIIENFKFILKNDYFTNLYINYQKLFTNKNSTANIIKIFKTICTC